MMIRSTIKILPSRSNHVGIITLNHPKALHALTLDMIHCIQDVVLAWCATTTTDNNNQPQPQQHGRMKAILFKSNTFDTTQQKVRAFCAGGNVKDLYYAGIKQQQQLQSSPSSSSSSNNNNNNNEQQPLPSHGNSITSGGLTSDDFFRQEYIMNHMLSQLNGSTVLQPQPQDQLQTIHQPPQQQQQREREHLPIQISMWDGIVMGGGVGLSIYGKYRIATEHTIFAMPENAIGLFPDVGSMYILPRIIQRHVQQQQQQQQTTAMCMTTYLLLTGTRLQPYDVVVTTGLATHFIPSHQLLELEKALIRASADDDDDDDDDDNEREDDDDYKKDNETNTSASRATPTATAPKGDTTTVGNNKEIVTDVFGPILDSFHDGTGLIESTSILLPHMNDIEYVFTINEQTTMECIITKLQERTDTSTFAQQTLTTLLKMSPTSLRITLVGLQRNLFNTIDNKSTGSNNDNTNPQHSFYNELRHEFRTVQYCMRPNSDFYEGIRATLIDKDHKPQWSPSTLTTTINESTIGSSYIDDQILPSHEWDVPPEFDLLAVTDDSFKDRSDHFTTIITTESKL